MELVVLCDSVFFYIKYIENHFSVDIHTVDIHHGHQLFYHSDYDVINSFAITIVILNLQAWGWWGMLHS